LVTKRVTGWLNLRFLGRGYRFRRGPKILKALTAELRQRQPDHVVFSGDATALAFEAEFDRAARALGVGDPQMPPGFAVPGNHDVYVRTAARRGLFESYFAPWQQGERVDSQTYPFARRAGPVWLIGVNSSTFNLATWDARGRVGAAQRDRLQRLLASLAPGPRILVTHYPVALANGQREHSWRRLRDDRELIRIASEGGVCLWLHGHRHRPYHLPAGAAAPFAIICGGSTTQTGLWTYAEYRIEESRLYARRRVYDPGTAGFVDGEEFELVLGSTPWVKS
jgi:3',5'-cyclic AMP phosphodiesterase CpdA